MPGIKAQKKYSGFAGRMDRFFNSVAYPISLIPLCVYAGMGGYRQYVPCICIFAVIVLLSVLFSSEYKPLLVPMLMAVFAVGRDKEALPCETAEDGIMYTENWSAVAFVLILAVAVGMILLIRFWKEGVFRDLWKKRGALTGGVLAMVIAFLCNGLISPFWRPMNVLYGLLLAFGFVFFYFLSVVIAGQGKNVARFACQCMVCASLAGIVQMTAVLLQTHQTEGLTFVSGMLASENRMHLSYSWWVPTTWCAYIAIGIPAAFYLASNHRYSGISYVLAFVIYGSIVVTQAARSALLTGGVTLLAGACLCCFGKNKKVCRIYGLTALALAITALFLCHFCYKPVWEIAEQLWKVSRLADAGTDSRLDYWSSGIKDFLSAPLFGVGFRAEAGQTMDNVFGSMYHNILVQFPASMGLIGAAAFGLHMVQFGKLFYKPDSKRLLLLLLPTMILALSLVDNFFFYINQQIAYCVFLTFAEQGIDNREDNP